MTALFTCLFALALLASVWVIAASWLAYGSGAMTLRAQLEACPESMEIVRTSVERRQAAPLAFRKGRPERSVRRNPRTPGLEWPGTALAA